MLSSLAIGLASENTQAVESWGTKQVVLNKNANINLNQSILTKKDLKNDYIGKNEAYIGQVAVVTKAKNAHPFLHNFWELRKTSLFIKTKI